jgi:type IV fimbrial biogenesis protein FimT
MAARCLQRASTGVSLLERGFTAFELLIAVAVSAILAAVAAPSLRDFGNETRLRSVSAQLLADLNFARLEAIKRNARVLVCAKAAGSNTCAAANNWQNGWIVCYDADSNDACDATSTSDPNPMKVTGALASTVLLTASSNFIRFNPVGSANGATALTLKGSWTGTSTRTASIAATGYITTAKN